MTGVCAFSGVKPSNVSVGKSVHLLHWLSGWGGCWALWDTFPVVFLIELQKPKWQCNILVGLCCRACCRLSFLALFKDQKNFFLFRDVVADEPNVQDAASNASGCLNRGCASCQKLLWAPFAVQLATVFFWAPFFGLSFNSNVFARTVQ